MRKLLLVCIIFAGCTSKEKQITAKAESYLKTQLNDPSSYQLIESMITDTTMLSDDLKFKSSIDTLDLNAALHTSEMDSLNFMISNIGSDIKSIDPSRLEDLKQINECREKTKLSKTNLTNLKGDSVHMIGMQFKYRAKNGMGALTIHNTRIAFFPSENRFSAKESKE